LEFLASKAKLLLYQFSALIGVLVDLFRFALKFSLVWEICG